MFPRFRRLQNTSASCRGPREQQPLRGHARQQHARQRSPRQHAQRPPPQHDGQRLQLPRPQVRIPTRAVSFREVHSARKRLQLGSFPT